MMRAGGRFLQVPEFVTNGIDNGCPDWWKQGCGCDMCFGGVANVLETVTPFVEQLGNCIWILGSPLAFPCIFFFPSDPHTHESSGYEISMMQAPCKRPCVCLLSTVCVPCSQWYVRRKVLGGDMTKYKLWQGYHDGPQCCARACPSMPITIQAGTYGEQDCPNVFLCLEVTCLGGFYSTCCAFDVSRRYQRQERGLDLDPTEQRQHKCIQFFSRIMHHCFKLGCCMCVSGCCVGLCAPDSSGAQDFAGESKRAARACCRIAHTIWKGIIWTRVLGMGCMTTQMIHEAESEWNGQPKKRPDLRAPKKETMKDRGAPTDNDTENDEPETELGDMLMPWEKEEANQNAAAANRRNAPQNARMDGR